MTPDEALANATEILQLTERMIVLLEKAEQAMRHGFKDEASIPFSHLRQIAANEGQGVYISVGLMLAATIAIRYHRHKVTELEFSTAREQLLEFATDLHAMKRQPKSKLKKGG